MPEMTSRDSIWLRPERGRRGPAPEYSRAQLGAAGVLLADSDGLSSVTMRSVAAAVGGAPASLYRYVDARAELLELMIDQVNGEFSFRHPADPAGPVNRTAVATDDGWMTGLLSLARQSRAIYLRHPWLIEATGSPSRLGPNTVRYLEQALAVMAPLNLSGRTKLEAVGMLNGVVRLLTQNELDQLQAGATVTEWQRSLAGYLTHVVESGGHPHLAAALTAPPADLEPDSSLDLFDRTVTRVLSGLLLRS
jgi:AcrR family transcriptional regulator